MKELIQLLQQRYQLTDKDMLREMAEHMTIYHAEKGENIVVEGEMQTNVYFLISGIVRGFYFSEQGKEITDCFVYEPGEIIASDLLEESRATITEQALVESELAALPIQAIYPLMNKYQEIMKIYLTCLNLNLYRHRNHKIALSRYCAENRYRWMKRTYPELIPMVKKKYIASFLNITQQTMSSLRKREKEEQSGTTPDAEHPDVDE